MDIAKKSAARKTQKLGKAAARLRLPRASGFCVLTILLAMPHPGGPEVHPADLMTGASGAPWGHGPGEAMGPKSY